MFGHLICSGLLGFEEFILWITILSFLYEHIFVWPLCFYSHCEASLFAESVHPGEQTVWLHVDFKLPVLFCFSPQNGRVEIFSSCILQFLFLYLKSDVAIAGSVSMYYFRSRAHLCQCTILRLY